LFYKSLWGKSPRLKVGVATVSGFLTVGLFKSQARRVFRSGEPRAAGPNRNSRGSKVRATDRSCSADLLGLGRFVIAGGHTPKALAEKRGSKRSALRMIASRSLRATPRNALTKSRVG